MGLQENLASEPVTKLALREAVCVSPATPVRKAVDAIKDKHLGCVIVVDPAQKPIGTFTESMLVDLLVHQPKALEDRVDAHLDKKWARVKQTDPISSVLAAMQQQDLRFVVVTDEEGCAKALSGQKGLMEYIADHFPRRVLVQQVGAKPFIHEREGA